MKAYRFVKGDCRAHGPITSRPLTMNYLGKKQGYPEPATGPNRHERRRAKALTRYTFLKGVSGARILRRMVRAQGLRETILMMHGKAK